MDEGESSLVIVGESKLDEYIEKALKRAKKQIKKQIKAADKEVEFYLKELEASE
jgi:ribosomal protein S21